MFPLASLTNKTNHKIFCDYSHYLKAHGHPRGTIEQYLYYPCRMVESLEVTPWQVGSDDIMGWLADHEWKPNTRKRVIGSLRAFYTWAYNTGRTLETPTQVLKKIKVDAGVPRPCPDNVYHRGLERAPDSLTEWQLRLAANTGLRRAELAAVRREDVEHHGGAPWLRVIGKGRKERIVPLPQPLADWLSRRPWAFPSAYGGCLTPSAVGKRLSPLLDSGWTLHTLRHRYATIAYQRTGDIRAVQKLLGHESIRTTQLYVDVAPDALLFTAMQVWATEGDEPEAVA